MKSKFLQALLILIASFCNSACGAPVKPIGRDFFGLTIHRAHSTTAWPSVDFGSWRLWDSYVKWSDIQPSRGEYDYSRLDIQVALAEAHNVEVMYTFGQTPAWASKTPHEKHAWGYGAGSMPTDINDFKDYVDTTIRRYKGRIHAYEIWNEPKFKNFGFCKGAIFFCGTPDELVELTRIIYNSAKSIDPNIKIISPGFTDSQSGIERLDQYLSAGGSKYVDVISFHFYVNNPEDTILINKKLKSVLKKHHIEHLPIWNTEVGYLIQNDNNSVVPEHSTGPFSTVYTPQKASELLFKTYMISASTGISRVYWYAWDDARMGATRINSHQQTAVGNAYSFLSKFLSGNTVDCHTINNDIWRCEIKSNKNEFHAYWNNSEKKYVVKLLKNEMILNIYGNPIDKNLESIISIGSEPVIVGTDQP